MPRGNDVLGALDLWWKCACGCENYKVPFILLRVPVSPCSRTAMACPALFVVLVTDCTVIGIGILA